MLLVVDVGNTETVIGVYKKEDLKAHWKLSSKMPRTADECRALLRMWCEAQKIALVDVEGFVISSVVPSLTMVFREVAQKQFDVEPIVVTTETDSGLKILYDTPRTVGADRICNAVAGYVLYGGPLIIVDFGTATTFDVVSEKGDYVGGVISLGLVSASQELHRLAAKLPRVDLAFPSHVVGSSTEESMQSGIMWGTVALVDGMVDRIISEMNWESAQVISTGGLASMLVEKSERIQTVEPFLTLEGMRLIYQRLSRKGG
jgi:type III pantothenate kinase